MVRVEREGHAAVLQQDAALGAGDAAAEAAEQRVDEADGVAVLVHHRDVDGVGMDGNRRRGGGDRRALRVDAGSQLGRVVGRQYLVDRHRRLRRVAEMGVALLVGEAEFGRAHVWTPVTNAHLVCRLLLSTKITKYSST